MSEALSRLTDVVLRASLDASLLCLLILGLKMLLGRRWPARWHAAVWLALILRLCLPAPVFSWHVPITLPVIQAPAPSSHSGKPIETSTYSAGRRSSPVPGRLPRSTILPFLWLAGALTTAAFLASGVLRFWLAVRKGRVVTSEPILRLLESTKVEMGLRVLVGLVETDRVRAPALFGFLRPRLLLPKGFLEAFDAEELYYIFRHELAHLKRLDILTGWLVCLLQALHWFNPLIWYAFLQWRRDRELACDETAVWHLDAPATARYGHTLLQLFERFKGPEPLPNLAGVLETPSNLSRRILMISRLAQGCERRWPLASLLVLGGLTVVSMSGFAHASDRSVAVPAAAVAPAPEPWHGFVNDADLLGGWRTADFVKRVEDFQPDQRQWKDPDYLQEMFFHADGTGREVCVNGNSNKWKWTLGKIYAGSPTEGRYEIRQMAGRTFLFFAWMNGDVLSRGHKPYWVVLEKAPRLREVASRVQDRIDYPFDNDPACLGNWSSVDFVARIEDFKPAERHTKEEAMPFKGLEFLPQGKTTGSYRWTRGLLLHDGDHTASRYEIRDMDGARYLFLEWKSGDYTHRGMRPSYYVLKAQ